MSNKDPQAIKSVLANQDAKVSYTSGTLTTWVGDFPPGDHNSNMTYDLTYRYWDEWYPRTTTYYQVVQ